MRRSLLYLVALLAIAGCNSGGSVATQTPPYVVYSSMRDGNEEIYRTDANGVSPLRLTSNGAQDHQPAFSHANDKIVYVTTLDGDHEVMVMNADGTGIAQLTTNSVADNCPRFSFDDSKIVFQRGTGVDCELWIMDADGSNQVQLTNNAFEDREPSFLPDGRIVFTSHRTGNRQLFVMDADGQNQTQLTTDPSFECYQADYSPDGTKIAFIRRANNIARMHLMDADGTNIVERGNSDLEFWPRWSPDGTVMVVTAVVAGNEDVYRVLPDGTGFTRITHSAFLDGHADW